MNKTLFELQSPLQSYPEQLKFRYFWREAWVCGLSLAGIAVSNPAGGKDVFLL